MKTFKTILTIMIICLTVTGISNAQNGKNKRLLKDEINSTMKQKLVTNLNISESEADKIMNAFSENGTNMKALNIERREIMNTIEQNPDAADVGTQLDKIINIDTRITETRKNFYKNLKSFLTPQQVAKALVLRMNIKKELKNQLRKNKNKNRPGNPDKNELN